ncbi:hypothetical protein [Pseudaestuariivita atlantica]|uniref:Uncharacterized protein n=1 Tax=Pseudaestuariivita atlantica TaxID=1317121 RepID=A0A0L1JKI9_9RHOB|nr:hypothetical protein [Pseudaestuariivita atlantica]KNG92274.1 hypothetical protein ATO11_18115 [Pseudaestuariivita atlantica]
MTFGTILPADWVVLMGLTAAALGTLAYLPYLRDTLRGDTRPHRATWLIWAVLSSISTVSQAYEGATSSLWFSGVQSGGTIIVFLLSIRMGMGSYLSRADALTLLAAVCGLGLWYATEDAVYALTISISISALGGVATVLKSYREPGTETLSCWYLNLAAAGIAVIVVGEVNWVLLAYPAYLFGLYTAIITAILAGRAAGRTVTARQAATA